jgi:hypothetical protein
MGRRQVEHAALFYEFSLEKHVPADHLLRSIDRFVELGELRRELASFYSTMGRPSVDPELMIRMLIVGYCFGIRSERRLDSARCRAMLGSPVVTPRRFGAVALKSWKKAGQRNGESGRWYSEGCPL